MSVSNSVSDLIVFQDLYEKSLLKRKYNTKGEVHTEMENDMYKENSHILNM